MALNTVKELMADRGRPHDNLYEVALWADMLRVQGDELPYAYMVDNQAIVVPETVDAIRALTSQASHSASRPGCRQLHTCGPGTAPVAGRSGPDRDGTRGGRPYRNDVLVRATLAAAVLRSAWPPSVSVQAKTTSSRWNAIRG